ncbi:hypothetical protein Lser_V15G09270 [Lactuca serriola]
MLTEKKKRLYPSLPFSLFLLGQDSTLSSPSRSASASGHLLHCLHFQHRATSFTAFVYNADQEFQSTDTFTSSPIGLMLLIDRFKAHDF